MSLSERLLAIYAGILTLALAVVILGGFLNEAKKANFDEIDTKRINIVEPDGTLRLVISSKARFPGLYIKGKEYPHDRNTAGLIFLNDEATENGGLIFGGSKNWQGKVETWGHLSFDQYMQDQVLAIDAGEENGHRYSRIKVLDEPDFPISDMIGVIESAAKLPREQRQDVLQKAFAAKPKPNDRVFLGRDTDRSVALRLKDPEGRDRIVIKVAADGTPIIQFLDAAGNVMRQLPEANPRISK
jgi:hypothetical protein